MKLYAEEDDFLIKRSNGLLLSNHDVKILEDNHIDYLKCHSLEELIFIIEDYLNNKDSTELEELSIKLGEYNYYNYTNK